MTFQQWIEGLIADRFGTATALAKAMGLQLTPFQRGAAGGTFNVINLLKLAKVADEHPSKVLRMAGKAEAADLIEELYGDGGDLSPSERAHLKEWQAVTESQRRALQSAIDEFLGKPVAVPRPGRKRKTA